MRIQCPVSWKFAPLAFCLGLVPAASSPAQIITTFSDLTVFNTAVGAAPMTVEDFTASIHYPISTGILNSATDLPAIGILPGTIQPGVTYSTPIGSGFFFNIDSGGNFAGGFLDGLTGSSFAPLTIAFNGTVSAFGFDTNLTLGTAFDITINFTNAESYSNTFSISSGSPVFYGFSSTSSNIQSIVFANHNQAGTFSFALDNFRFTNSNVSSIPEPGTAALLGVGLASLFLRFRRWNKPRRSV